jgi:outer membrane protein assembly factor BamB/pSer/pThr/pTyr-binding forkhead associated (FHA) protein
MIRLVLRYPNNVIREVEFEQPKYRIGSDKDNDLVIEDLGVAPHQAEIETTAGAYSIVDVSEDKSTTVNGKSVERSNLNYGDRIALGPVIALFYPVKKSRIGNKTKLYLYMGAGALVIILSIVFIFFLMSRQITSVVSSRMGEGLAPEEITSQPDVEAPESVETRMRERRPFLSREREKGTAARTALREGISEKRMPIELVLPEPSHSEIETREAVAVPRGVCRLFFRKVPVVFSSEIEAVPTGDTADEDLALEEEAGGAIVSEEEKGILNSILSPFKRLLKREESEEYIADFEEEYEEGGAEVVLEEREQAGPPPVEEERKREEAVLAADYDRVVNPLLMLAALDVPELREEVFEEEPIYESEEVIEIAENNRPQSPLLSEVETVNIAIAWRYPEEIEKIGPVLRSGAVLRINRWGDIHYLFGTRDGALLAVNGTTGEEIFSENFGKPFYDPIVEYIDQDRIKDIILVFEDGDIAAITAEFERLWYYDGEDSVTSLPALFDVNGDGTKDIVFATLNMDIVALDGSNGFELWRFSDAESEIIHSPVAADANGDAILDVLFCTEKGYLYLLDGKTGWALWKNPVFGRPAGSPVVADLDGDKTEEYVVLTRNGLLSSFKTDGKMLFTWEIEGGFITAPSIGDTDGDRINEIVLVDENGVLRCLEGKTRVEEWVFETDEVGSLGRVALSDLDGDGGADVVCCTYSGALFVLDGSSGSVIGVFNYGSHVMATPIVIDTDRDRVSEIIAGTYGGEVFALNVTDVKKKIFTMKNSSWFARNHDYRNTGFSKQYFLKNPWK